MLPDIDPAEHTAGSLRDSYVRHLQEAIETGGPAEIATTTGLDSETVEAIAGGETDDISLDEATAILATVEKRDADAIAAEARDRLLLSMSSAVLDVDALASRLAGDLSAKELQQKIEGRHPMTLREYAQMQATIAGES
jgi:hypothetical protein